MHWDVEQISAATGMTRQQIHRLVSLRLLAPPVGVAAGARYGPQQLSEIAQIQGLVKEGWAITELAELVARPHHWNRRGEPLSPSDGSGIGPNSGRATSVTAALHIMCTDEASACERRVLRAMVKAAQAELGEQKKISAMLSRRWRANKAVRQRG